MKRLKIDKFELNTCYLNKNMDNSIRLICVCNKSHSKVILCLNLFNICFFNFY